MKLDRRAFLSKLAAAAAVVGFDTIARGWTSGAQALPPSCDPVPALDGVLLADTETLGTFARDNGFIVTRTPWAVLFPGSVEDVAAMIAYCRCRGIPIGGRGQGHTTFGQSLVEGGVVVRMETLASIHEIGADFADVDAGVLWTELFDATLARGLTAPAHTAFLGLSIGGTLSMGGMPPAPRTGFQVDHVRALQVVTGRGDVVWCSADDDPDLFHGVLGGLGQLAIIVRAVVDLVPAPARVKAWVLRYLDPARCFADLRTLIDRGEAEWVFGQIVPPGPTALPEPPAAVVEALGPTAAAFRWGTPLLTPLLGAAGALLSQTEGVWIYQIVVGKNHEAGRSPSASFLLRGLSDLSLIRTSSDQTYRDFVLRVDALVDLLKTLGLWYDVPHPWFDVFLDDGVAEQFVTTTVRSFRYDDVGAAGLMLLLPVLRARHSVPQPPMPGGASDLVWLLGVETSAPGPGPNADFVAAKLARNRKLYERARDLGGKFYAHCALPKDPGDWAAQLGSYHAVLAALKQHYDPDGILTPGPNVF